MHISNSCVRIRTYNTRVASDTHFYIRVNCYKTNYYYYFFITNEKEQKKKVVLIKNSSLTFPRVEYSKVTRAPLLL